MTPSLAQLDLDLSHAYAVKKGTLSESQASALLRNQNLWLRRRNACGGRDACLRETMQSRLAELQAARVAQFPPGIPLIPPVTASGISPGGAPISPNTADTSGLSPSNRRRLEMQQRRAAMQEREAEIRQQQQQRQAENPQRPAIGSDAYNQLLIQRNRRPPVHPLADATPAGDEWRGAMTCGGATSFVRLVIPAVAGSAPQAPVIEFGPGPDNAGPRGSFRAMGNFPSGGGNFHLEPQAWIHQPSGFGSVSTFGLDGGRASDGKLSGKVIGRADCTDFRAWHIATVYSSENPRGLLQKLPPMAQALPGLLSDADCRSFNQWLATGRKLHIGSYYVLSLVYDTEGQKRVLGRTAEQWQVDDHLRMRAIENACKTALEKSPLLADQSLLHSIKLFTIVPLDMPKQDWLTPEWVRAELAPLLRTEAQRTASADLAKLSTLPPQPASYMIVDQAAAAARNSQGELHYLEDGDRMVLQGSIAAQRKAVGRSIIAAMGENFKTLPLNTDSLESMTRQADDTRLALTNAHDPDAAALVPQVADEVEREQATRIWPLFLADAKSKLTSLHDAGYERFGEIKNLRHGEAVLRGITPSPDSATDAAYNAASSAVADAMVTHSMSWLIAWVTALPPSNAANQRLAKFTQDTFGSADVPAKYEQLGDAVRVKIAGYNPDDYVRPDIVMPLMRHQWGEVAADGLDNLSYFATALHELNEHCPGVLPQEGTPESMTLLRYSLEGSKRAVDKLMSGQVTSQSERQRAAAIAINTIFNRPGCRESYGVVTSCTTLEQQAQVNEAIMTSSDAKVDMTKLAAKGCDSPDLKSYVTGALQFAAQYRGQMAPLFIPGP